MPDRSNEHKPAGGQAGKKPDAPPDTHDRTITGRPADPNRTGAKARIPPGIKSEDFRDPGRMTPDAPPVDNKS